jgi:hypothetical protein
MAKRIEEELHSFFSNLMMAEKREEKLQGFRVASAFRSCSQREVSLTLNLHIGIIYIRIWHIEARNPNLAPPL